MYGCVYKKRENVSRSLCVPLIPQSDVDTTVHIFGDAVQMIINGRLFSTS